MIKKSQIILLIIVILALANCSKNKESEVVLSESKIVSVGEPFGTKENPVTVNIIIKDVSPNEEATQMLTKEIEDGMSKNAQFVKINFINSPAGTYSEAIPIAVRTGQISPDIIYFQGGDLALANDGLLEELPPYIEKSTHIKNLIEDFQLKRLENYPYIIFLAPPRVTVPVIRKDFAKKDSVMKVIENPTTDNYYSMYKDLIDSGNVDYGVTFDGSLDRMDSAFKHAFGVTSSFMKKDGKYISHMVTEEEKNKLEFYSKLYADGIIDPEYIIMKWDVMENKFYDNTVAMIFATIGTVVQIYNNKMVAANGENAELIVLPPAKGISQGYTIDVTKESRGFAINTESKIKNEAFAVLEYMASPNGRLIDKLGIKDVHYSINSDNIYVLTKRFPEWWPRFWETFHQFPEDIKFTKNPMSKSHATSLDSYKKYGKEDINLIFPDELQPKWDALVSLYKNYSVDIITGKKPIAAFDEMVIEWYKSGGNEIDDYINKNISKLRK